jgi:hypothetical protein
LYSFAAKFFVKAFAPQSLQLTISLQLFYLRDFSLLGIKRIYLRVLSLQPLRFLSTCYPVCTNVHPRRSTKATSCSRTNHYSNVTHISLIFCLSDVDSGHCASHRRGRKGRERSKPCRGGEVKVSLQQAAEAHRVVRRRGSHISRQLAHRWR